MTKNLLRHFIKALLKNELNSITANRCLTNKQILHGQRFIWKLAIEEDFIGNAMYTKRNIFFSHFILMSIKNKRKIIKIIFLDLIVIIVTIIIKQPVNLAQKRLMFSISKFYNM